MMRGLLRIILTVGIMLVLSSVYVCAADIVDSGSCGENLTWSLDSEGILKISGTGIMEDYLISANGGEVRAPWYYKKSDILDISIGSGVTKIGRAHV